MRGFVKGIGWLTCGGAGRGRRPDAFQYAQGELPAVERKAIFAEPYPRFGRLDDFSRLGLAGIALALADAGIDSWRQKRPFGMIAASRYGCLATDQAFFASVLPEGGALASPNLFAYTLANTFLGEAAIRFGLTGPGFVVNQQLSGGFDALRLALETLADGTPVVVAGNLDLAPPPDWPAHRDCLPGAVFLVLAAKGEAGEPPLIWNEAEGLCAAGRPVADWPALVAACRGHLGEHA